MRTLNIALSSVFIFTLATCGGGDKKLELGGSCSLNSDCADGLLCKFGACHKACVKSVDCASGERCVQVDGVAVCQSVKEAACGLNFTCSAPLMCRQIDNSCRNKCSTSADCLGGQSCSGTFCLENAELSGIDASVVPDAEAVGTADVPPTKSDVTGDVGLATPNDARAVSPGVLDGGPSARCPNIKVLVYSLQPASSSATYESTALTGWIAYMNGLGYNFVLENRKSVPTIGASLLSPYGLLVLFNGCGGATGLPSSSELDAIKSYYLTGGSLMLSADDAAGDSTAPGDCQSRVNVVASNLGVNFSGSDFTYKLTTNPDYCVSVKSTHPLLANLSVGIGRYTSAVLKLTGSVAWGTGQPAIIGTLANTTQPSEAFIEKASSHGAALFDPDFNAFSAACKMQEYLGAYLSYLDPSCPLP